MYLYKNAANFQVHASFELANRYENGEVNKGVKGRGDMHLTLLAETSICQDHLSFYQFMILSVTSVS